MRRSEVQRGRESTHAQMHDEWAALIEQARDRVDLRGWTSEVERAQVDVAPDVERVREAAAAAYTGEAAQMLGWFEAADRIDRRNAAAEEKFDEVGEGWATSVGTVDPMVTYEADLASLSLEENFQDRYGMDIGAYRAEQSTLRDAARIVGSRGDETTAAIVAGSASAALPGERPFAARRGNAAGGAERGHGR